MQSPPRSTQSDNRPAVGLNRRGFLAGAASITVLAACGGSDNNTAPATADSDFDAEPVLSDDALWLQAGFADGFRVASTLAAGRPERAPFVFFGSDGLPAVNGLPDQIEFILTAPDGSVSSSMVGRRDVGIPTPYFPLEFTPTEPGDYGVEVGIEGETQRVDFRVAAASEVSLIVPGEPLRPVDTPTFDDARGFDPICTRFDPCAFHDVTITEALANGRPTALLIATPGFCQTAICGPVLELLIELDPTADMNVIHAEVYNEPARINEIGLSPELLGPVIDTYGMAFEPSLIVADADGIVTARLDYAFDLTETDAALRSSL